MLVVTCMLVATRLIVVAGVLAVVGGSVMVRVLDVNLMVAMSGVIAVISMFAVVFRHGLVPGHSWLWSVSLVRVVLAVAVGRHWLLPYRRIGWWMRGHGDQCAVRMRHVATAVTWRGPSGLRISAVALA
jgi:hypothetical protein